MFENPRRGRQARNFTTNNAKILDLRSSSEQIFSRKLPLGAPGKTDDLMESTSAGTIQRLTVLDDAVMLSRTKTFYVQTYFRERSE